MANVYLTALDAIRRDAAGLDRVAMNVANMTTPGFKREAVAEQSFEAAMRSSSVPVGAKTGASAPAAATPAGMLAVLDARPGTLRETGRALDVALTGGGFFEVATPSGPAYTRQGSFRLDETGRMVTADGNPVMGGGGEVTLSTASPTIDQQGNIVEPDQAGGGHGRTVGQLKIVVFEDPGKLERIGGGLFAKREDGVASVPSEESGRQVRQGALEESNVDAMQEMLQLIRNMRHVESMQKVVQGYDELLGLGIRKLGELS